MEATIGLLGVVLGSALTWMTETWRERRRWKREDRVRTRDQTRDACARFLATVDSAVGAVEKYRSFAVALDRVTDEETTAGKALLKGTEDAERDFKKDRSRYLTAFQEISLTGSRAVVERASVLHDGLEKHARWWAISAVPDWGKLPPWEQKLRTAQAEFVDEVRKQLETSDG